MKHFTLLALALCALSAGAASGADESPMEAYLLAYFLDSDHDLHFAVSDDGYRFEAVNANLPIVLGDTVAVQHGIRDPHIYRGPDGRFYLTATDLHIFGQREGYRDTQWERPEEYGWGNNRGLVLMRSDDLVNWTHSNVLLDHLYPDMGCAWAPQTIYDPEAGRMMVYFTLRVVAEHLEGAHAPENRTRIFYAYTDDDFTTFATEPELLYQHPDSTRHILDADICPMPQGGYMMTYVMNEWPQSDVYVAYSDHINRGYDFHPDPIDAESVACEAPNVWRRIGEDRWVLMYDIFGVFPSNFGFMETTDLRTFTPAGRFGEGPYSTDGFTSPKHGSVIPITASEATRLRSLGK